MKCLALNELMNLCLWNKIGNAGFYVNSKLIIASFLLNSNIVWKLYATNKSEVILREY